MIERNSLNCGYSLTLTRFLFFHDAVPTFLKEDLKEVRKILFYAPANDEGLSIMRDILVNELDLPEQHLHNSKGNTDTAGWILLPMNQTSTNNLTATNLGDILTDILKRTRDLQHNSSNGEETEKGKVMFLGMDSPELPMEEIVASFRSSTTICSNKSTDKPSIDQNTSESYQAQEMAVLCPANDGGYGMLCVPSRAPTMAVFQGIRWSNQPTALGQLKALTDCGIPVRLGRLMNDIDEPEDVNALCQRLRSRRKRQVEEQVDTTDAAEVNGDVLLKSSIRANKIRTGDCRHTTRVLRELGLLS